MRAGGRVLMSSGPSQAPLFLSFTDQDGERVSACLYVFLANRRETRNRPQDEHRLQIRYGDVNDPQWRAGPHPVGFDPLGVDVTLVVGAHIEADLVVGLDPLVYDPLPVGISVFFRDSEIDEASRTGWNVWERDNISGVVRRSPRTQLGIETIVAFKPERFLDYVRFERDAQALRLDPALRFAAASRPPRAGRSALRTPWNLSSASLGMRSSTSSASVRGAAGRTVAASPSVSSSSRRYSDHRRSLGRPCATRGTAGLLRPVRRVPPGRPGRVQERFPEDVRRRHTEGRDTEDANVAKGVLKSRLYDPAQFDVVAACMYGPWRRWEFLYKRSDRLLRDKANPDRIAPIQRIDESWSETLAGAMARR